MCCPDAGYEAMHCEAMALLALTRAIKSMLVYSLDSYLAPDKSTVPALTASYMTDHTSVALLAVLLPV